VPAEQSTHLLAIAPENVPVAQLLHFVEASLSLKLPARQFKQVVAPVSLWYVPEAQPAQIFATPPAEYIPAAQLEHCKPVLYSPALQRTTSQKLDSTADLEPAAHTAQVLAPPAEYVLTTQTMQPVAPVVAVYLPAVQLAHWVPPVVSLKVPAAQLVHALEPASEYMPTEQLVQLFAFPVAYDPAAQLAHAEVTPGEYFPCSQPLQLGEAATAAYRAVEQSSHFVAPVEAWDFPTGQSSQAFDSATEAYVPAVQPEQLVEFAAFAKVPAAHFAHIMAPVAEEYWPSVQAVHNVLPVKS